MLAQICRSVWGDIVVVGGTSDGPEGRRVAGVMGALTATSADPDPEVRKAARLALQQLQ